MRRRSLGRGLSELLSGEGLGLTRAVVELPVHRLTPNPRQPRSEMQADSLEELTQSIEAHGVIQPIIVRAVGEEYEILAGERRWRAAQRAGLESVPCVIQQASDQESLEIALIENLQRADLNPIEAARGYRRLMDEFGLTQEGVAAVIGKSRSAVANTMRLLDLPEPVQEAIQRGQLSEGHGRALLGLGAGSAKLQALWPQVVERQLTVRETEQLVRDALTAPEPPPSRPDEPSKPDRMDPNLREAQERIQDALATRVVIRPGSRGTGKIEVHYGSAEEFERLFELLCSVG